MTIRVTFWNEHRHERIDEAVKRIYPDGLHAPVVQALRAAGMNVRVATLDDLEHGLTEPVLAGTDVLIWWGHTAHEEVRQEIVARVHERVLGGLGLVVLHSGHFSRIFRTLMGTACTLKWREAGERERVWVVAPSHPIAEGLGEGFDIEHEEMYGEFFDIPAPDELVLISSFAGGEVFRSGCCFYRGRGKIFYFRPGHETNPTYYNLQVQRVIANAVRWATPAPSPLTPLPNGERGN